MPDPVAQAFERFPPLARARLLDIRSLIFEVAGPEIGPLTETLKWGEPAYLPQNRQDGHDGPSGLESGTARGLRGLCPLPDKSGRGISARFSTSVSI